MEHILKFANLQQDLWQPVEELQSQLGFTIAQEQIAEAEIIVQRIDEGLKVEFEEDKIKLFYRNKVEFFRGLGLILEALESEKREEIKEIPVFTHLTYMQDNSRNAVCNIPSVQKTIRQLALMGYDSFMLYTEDTYEIEGYPYFGYMRGRYSKEELLALNSYAIQFGIELIPCIQTLAHLNGIFHWSAFDEIRDLGDILLSGNDKTYELIEAMVKTCAETFSSRRINIGMDEAEMLGLGKYLKHNGYTERADIMMKHLRKVVEICNKYGFQVMMWSDMFFKMLPNNSDYNLSADITGLIFDSLAKLAHVLALKCDMGIRLKKAYDQKNTEVLTKIAFEECPELIQRIETFHQAFRKQWYHENKPFGFDVQDLRIGGLKERIHAVTWSVKRYLDGSINRIEELDQERLLLDHRENIGYRTLPLYHNEWRSMVTASVL
jgi:hypothetical protein